MPGVREVPAFIGKPAIVNSTATAGGVKLLSTNTGRQGISIVNDSSAILYVRNGADAPPSATDYNYKLAAGAQYDYPVAFVGEVWGIWASQNGQARVTDYC